MSGFDYSKIEPTAPTGAVESVQPAQHRNPAQPGARGQAAHSEQASRLTVAAIEGQMRAAYAQFVIDPNTHDVVLRILDAATNQILHEVPSTDVQAMTRSLQEYSDIVARRRAAAHHGQPS